MTNLSTNIVLRTVFWYIFNLCGKRRAIQVAWEIDINKILGQNEVQWIAAGRVKMTKGHTLQYLEPLHEVNHRNGEIDTDKDSSESGEGTNE